MSSLSTNQHLTMESLDLPQELYWDGKLEPTSPSSVSSELFALNETTPTWLYDDNFANGITIFNDAPMDETESLELSNGEDLIVEFVDFKEEHLLDSKTQTLPQLAEFVNCIEVAHPNAITKVHATHEQLSSLGISQNYENAVLAQLTPPQSPPQCSSASIASTAGYHQQLPNDASESAKNFMVSETTPIAAFNNTANLYNFTNVWGNAGVDAAVVAATVVTNNDIARENQIVDEILNIRAQELRNWPCKIDDDEVSQASSVYSAAPSQSDTSASSSCADDEWFPTSVGNSSYCSSNGSSPIHNSSEELQHVLATNAQASTYATSNATTSSSVSKKRTRTYGRGIEDRKIRKKEQNKNAATRYRQKKKQEMEYVQGEEQVLEQRNEELKRMLAERMHESKYLRKLLREFYKERKH